MNLQKSLIVSSTGQAMFGVGGQHVHAMHDYKGYTVSMEWDTKDGEPVMLIWSSISGLGAGVFGICLSSAGKYADPSGKPTEECLVQCAAALPTLGRAMLGIEVHTLVDVVMQFMPELLCMPPAPRAVRLGAKGEAMFEVSQENQYGKTVSERLV